MSDITAVLTIYRRPYTLIEQVRAIRNQSVRPAAVWAFAQEPSEETLARLSSLHLDRVVSCNPNSYFHLRFAVAMTAQTEYVALFDDDTIPGAAWFENCLSTMREHPGILGTAGIRVDPSSYAGREVLGWPTPSESAHEVDYNGHSWFCSPQALRHLFAVPLATGTNGEDIELGARAWRLGNVRSYVPPHPPGEPALWGSTEGRRFGNDAVASYRRGGYMDERFRIIQTEIAAGWRPLCLRNGREREYEIEDRR